MVVAPPLPKLEQQDHLQGESVCFESPKNNVACFGSPKHNVAAAALPPTVVATEPATAAKAGAVRRPAK